VDTLTLENRLLEELVTDTGCSADVIRDAIEAPRWDANATSWEFHVSPSIRNLWPYLSSESRLALAYLAQSYADSMDWD
jgi:hypothetical protein